MPEEEALLVVDLLLLLVVGLLLVGGPLQVAALSEAALVLSEAALVLSVAVLSVVALSEAAALADLTVVALQQEHTGHHMLLEHQSIDIQDPMDML